jgi:hypothetical protein
MENLTNKHQMKAKVKVQSFYKPSLTSLLSVAHSTIFSYSHFGHDHIPKLSTPLVIGVIISIDIFTLISGVILFEYNPETITRRLQVMTFGEGGNESEALRLDGAPEENISLDIEIDATDQLEKVEDTAVSMDINSYPLQKS